MWICWYLILIYVPLRLLENKFWHFACINQEELSCHLVLQMRYNWHINDMAVKFIFRLLVSQCLMVHFPCVLATRMLINMMFPFMISLNFELWHYALKKKPSVYQINGLIQLHFLFNLFSFFGHWLLKMILLSSHLRFLCYLTLTWDFTGVLKWSSYLKHRWMILIWSFVDNQNVTIMCDILVVAIMVIYLFA